MIGSRYWRFTLIYFLGAVLVLTIWRELFFFCLAYFKVLFIIDFSGGRSNPFMLTHTRRRYPEDRFEWIYLESADGKTLYVLFSWVNIQRYLHKFFNNYILRALSSTRISKNFYIKWTNIKNAFKALVWRPNFKKQGYIRTFFKKFKK